MLPTSPAFAATAALFPVHTCATADGRAHTPALAEENNRPKPATSVHSLPPTPIISPAANSIHHMLGPKNRVRCLHVSFPSPSLSLPHVMTVNITLEPLRMTLLRQAADRKDQTSDLDFLYTILHQCLAQQQPANIPFSQSAQCHITLLAVCGPTSSTASSKSSAPLLHALLRVAP